ncbi:hypothetical protein NUM_07730 [Actinocatenispora comari]|jgi:hypothetical protein|uniref:Uncharacterized protein n=1 Tax=Actinocatenispora comari TaxID=2807577 RepID=A0A8J4AB44_9ACTN|nr:hypothetical protein NUM_07730 [Actinocatenispora comari]
MVAGGTGHDRLGRAVLGAGRSGEIVGASPNHPIHDRAAPVARRGKTGAAGHTGAEGGAAGRGRGSAAARAAVGPGRGGSADATCWCAKDWARMAWAAGGQGYAL